MRSTPVKLTRDLRVLVPPDAPPLSGSQALELGRKLIQQGAIKVALEAVGRDELSSRRATAR